MINTGMFTKLRYDRCVRNATGHTSPTVSVSEWGWCFVHDAVDPGSAVTSLYAMAGAAFHIDIACRQEPRVSNSGADRFVHNYALRVLLRCPSPIIRRLRSSPYKPP
jgi:hypothetical protein